MHYFGIQYLGIGYVAKYYSFKQLWFEFYYCTAPTYKIVLLRHRPRYENVCMCVFP